MQRWLKCWEALCHDLSRPSKHFFYHPSLRAVRKGPSKSAFTQMQSTGQVYPRWRVPQHMGLAFCPCDQIPERKATSVLGHMIHVTGWSDPAHHGCGSMWQSQRQEPGQDMPFTGKPSVSCFSQPTPSSHNQLKFWIHLRVNPWIQWKPSRSNPLWRLCRRHTQGFVLSNPVDRKEHHMQVYVTMRVGSRGLNPPVWSWLPHAPFYLTSPQPQTPGQSTKLSTWHFPVTLNLIRLNQTLRHPKSAPPLPSLSQEEYFWITWA